MARNKRPKAIQDRAARTAAALATPAGSVAQKKTGAFDWIVGLPRFFREVRAEAKKITWTSRKETWITSVMVAIMVVLAALFFAVINWVISQGITLILRLATGG